MNSAPSALCHRLVFERGSSPSKRMAPPASAWPWSAAGTAGLACAPGSRCSATTPRCSKRGQGRRANEYGVAAYKVPHDFAQREVAFILSRGGIDLRAARRSPRRDASPRCGATYDAVFSAPASRRQRGSSRARVFRAWRTPLYHRAPAQGSRQIEAADRPARRRSRGGNTSDRHRGPGQAARRRRRHDVYRRGPENMGAHAARAEFAQTNGVRIKHWARPARALGEAGVLKAVEFERTGAEAGARFRLEAEHAVKAIGQFRGGTPQRRQRRARARERAHLP